MNKDTVRDSSKTISPKRKKLINKKAHTSTIPVIERMKHLQIAI